jgi:hypothetical protein
MKKVLLVIVAVIGLGIMANAQDIILKKDGSEIKVKVIEITDQQVKYKDFDFQDGPIRSINSSEIFMITYENGQKEVMDKPNATNTSSSKKQSLRNCVKKTAVGLDIGIGGGKESEVFSSALGIRVMHHFNPYFGVDFFKINWITDVVAQDLLQGLWTMKLQLMPGVRGNSPTFFKCMSVYGAFRLGYGMHVATGYKGTLADGATDFKGLCLETELGVNITPAIFVGFSYNYHKGFGDYFSDSPWQHTFSTRFGFNFGKNDGRGRVYNMKTYSQKSYKREKNEKIKREKNEKILTGEKLLGYGIGVSAVGIFLMVPGFVTGDYKLPVVVVGSVITGIGGGLTIASIPVLAAGVKERAIKNNFAIENFGVFDNSYQPTLNLSYIGNGIGVSLKF